MGKTAAEKIVSAHVHEEVKAGDFVIADVDLAMIHDTTGPIAIKAFEEYGRKRVWDPSKMVIVLDHATPSPNERISNLHALLRSFASSQGIPLFDAGEGVCHQLVVEKGEENPGEDVLVVDGLTVHSKLYKKDAVKNVSFAARAGEILCIAGIDGNGQTELVHALTGLEKISAGKVTLCGHDITEAPIRQRSADGMSHIPEDRHKHGLILDFTLEQNLALQRYYEPRFQQNGFIRFFKRLQQCRCRSAFTLFKNSDIEL